METLNLLFVEDLQVALSVALFRLSIDLPVAEVIEVLHEISATDILPALFHIIFKNLSEPDKLMNIHP